MSKKTTKRELKNIVPFNKFMFRSCYYHQLITAYGHYGVGEEYVLNNYLNLYDFNDETNVPCNFDIAFWDEGESERLSGLRLIKEKDSEDFTSEVIRALNRGIPVITAVDVFYLNYREDTYKKYHGSHFILIYGYDLERKKFLINEHCFLNSINYSPRWSSFTLIKTAWSNYVKRLLSTEKSGYSYIKVKKIGSRQPILHHYGDLIKSKKDKICESLIAMQKTSKLIVQACKTKDLLEQKLDVLLKFIGMIRPKKEQEKTRLFSLNPALLESVDRVLENYIFIYGVFAKFKFAKIITSFSLEKCINRMNEILELETQIHYFYMGKDYEALC